MRILFVTSEVQHLAKSGGLGDVSRALPIALKRQGIDVRILLPGYPDALMRLDNPRIEAHLKPMLGVTNAALISGTLPNSNVPVWLIHAPSLFSRVGGLYQDGNGQDWPDNALRFAFFARVAAELSFGRLADWWPDIVHANDWHAGLVPLLLSMEGSCRPATLFTIHNLAFQGIFEKDVLPAIDIPEKYFAQKGTERCGRISYLKAAIDYSDRITTVSPAYAREVITPEHGCGLEGALLQRRADFSGILNGIDNDMWNPETDIHLSHHFSARDISGKRLCKAALQSLSGLEVDRDVPLIGFISRLARQKMADIVLEIAPRIVARGAQFVLVGEGDRDLETAFHNLKRRYPHRMAIHIGYDEQLDHCLQAGSDMLLAPARFEPCGLTQLYALRYGTVPIVRRTGGFVDTVTDAGQANKKTTGFVFENATSAALLGAVDRALALYKEPLAWRRLQRQGMIKDFGSRTSAARYRTLYEELSDNILSAPAILPLDQNEAMARQFAV